MSWAASSAIAALLGGQRLHAADLQPRQAPAALAEARLGLRDQRRRGALGGQRAGVAQVVAAVLARPARVPSSSRPRASSSRVVGGAQARDRLLEQRDVAAQHARGRAARRRARPARRTRAPRRRVSSDERERRLALAERRVRQRGVGRPVVRERAAPRGPHGRSRSPDQQQVVERARAASPWASRSRPRAASTSPQNAASGTSAVEPRVGEHRARPGRARPPRSGSARAWRTAAGARSSSGSLTPPGPARRRRARRRARRARARPARGGSRRPGR